MRRFVLVATLAILGFSNQAAAVEYRPETIAITDADVVRAEFSKTSQTQSDYLKGLWTPTEEQAKAAYSALASGLQDPNLPTGVWAERHAQSVLAKTLQTYRVKISGITAREGSDAAINGQPGARMIDLYGICPAEKMENWRSSGLAIVADGGTCFFNARYDPRKDKIIFFAFGGN